MTLNLKYNEIRRESLAEGRAEGRIIQIIEDGIEYGIDKDTIIQKLVSRHALTKEKAEEYYNNYSSTISK